jgi:hypothetical protein
MSYTQSVDSKYNYRVLGLHHITLHKFYGRKLFCSTFHFSINITRFLPWPSQFAETIGKLLGPWKESCDVDREMKREREEFSSADGMSRAMMSSHVTQIRHTASA